jgi:protein translocase SecG subunit
MQIILHWTLIITAVLLSFSILLQHKSSGLGAGFGGTGGNSYSSKRGLDRILVIATVIFAVIFFGTAVATLFV